MSDSRKRPAGDVEITSIQPIPADPMLLTITTTHRPATDLGHLLHKNPARYQTQPLQFGTAHQFYTEASDERCTYALLVEVDPVALVRGKGKGRDRLLDHYVNDRPYAASSFLSVAMARALRTALGGRSEAMPELANTAIPLEATVAPLACRGDEALIERMFSPLGYDIETNFFPLDEKFEDWGMSPYAELRLRATCRLSALLNHLYLLIPVLDKNKHYFVQRDELEKLLAKGEGWLAQHPEKELIARRYLQYKRTLASEALERLRDDDVSEEDLDCESRDSGEEALEKPIRLHDLRLDRVADVLAEAKVRRVIDLGCGDGKLLRRLMKNKQFSELLGVDVSSVSLMRAEKRLKLDRAPDRQHKRVRLIQGALTYRDARLEGYDAAALVEVIEHLDPDRLQSMERAIFEFASPAMVVVTTPNREYNAKFEGLVDGKLRHPDHRFEWTRAEFKGWAEPIAERYGYSVEFSPIGEIDDQFGAPSQMAVFKQ